MAGGRARGKSTMEDAEWEAFFNLLAKIVDLEGLTYSEKRKLVEDKAVVCFCKMTLIEFTSWDWE